MSIDTAHPRPLRPLLVLLSCCLGVCNPARASAHAGPWTCAVLACARAWTARAVVEAGARCTTACTCGNRQRLAAQNASARAREGPTRYVLPRFSQANMYSPDLCLLKEGREGEM